VSRAAAEPASPMEAVHAALDADGIALVPGALSQEECRVAVDRLESILRQRLENGVFVGNRTYQVLYNYFMEDRGLLSLIALDLCDEVMRRAIDDDYVLISPSARNRQSRGDLPADRPTSGVGWHIDSRRIGGRTPVVLRPSPIFFAVIALDDLGPENGATHYIPGSHKRYERPIDRDAAPSDSRVLEARAGSLIFMDSALWHRVGDASGARRWMIFNMYGPWFMKPYFDFSSMFPPSEAAGLQPLLRQLLHFDSRPPRDHTEGTITLRRVREAATS
jgi:hypothetical protein